MKIHPMAVNHILLETDSGIVIDINENTIKRSDSIITVRLADSMDSHIFDWITTAGFGRVGIEIRRR